MSSPNAVVVVGGGGRFSDHPGFASFRGIHSKTSAGKNHHEEIRTGCIKHMRSLFSSAALTRKTYVRYSSTEQKYHERYGL
eukprot:scaffold2679_cov251-Pinguiococcus_pyrenoidosus.AAC.15